MPKVRLFIGSSVENLDVAYAIQEALEHDAEVTVWTQGLFDLSKYTLQSLMDALDELDFGLFVFSPDDLTKIRDDTKKTVRDNVVFELGLFIGRLGQERNFILVPRGDVELHLPSDLLGLTPAYYEPDRQDENLAAAVGPACNRVRKAMAKLGANATPFDALTEREEQPYGAQVIENREDCIALIESWMGGRPSYLNSRAIKYIDVDRELGLKPGSARSYIEEAAKSWHYAVARKGQEVILFAESRGNSSLF
jgi:hypothetical protein